LSPILGIWASQNYPRVTSSYESIQTVTVGAGGSSSIQFSSIPQTYTHLQLRCLTKTSNAGAPYAMQIRFNGDSGANYAYHRLIGNGSAASALGTTGASQASLNYMSASGETNIFSGAVVDILDYTNTNKNTVHRTLGGYDANGSGNATFFSGVWLNTAAVSSITVISESGSTLAQYSSIALYGIK
jgi:hypothetical protein